MVTWIHTNISEPIHFFFKVNECVASTTKHGQNPSTIGFDHSNSHEMNREPSERGIKTNKQTQNFAKG